MSNYTYQHDPRISGADFDDDDDIEHEVCNKCLRLFATEEELDDDNGDLELNECRSCGLWTVYTTSVN